ncbi:MAG TPA: hypothetical protein DCQ98_01360 [Planctomycetaceae bacterium]|nr:hypothetical protein [Planctomycetaceae bacterium]
MGVTRVHGVWVCGSPDSDPVVRVGPAVPSTSTAPPSGISADPKSTGRTLVSAIRITAKRPTSDHASRRKNRRRGPKRERGGLPKSIAPDLLAVRVGPSFDRSDGAAATRISADSP